MAFYDAMNDMWLEQAIPCQHQEENNEETDENIETNEEDVEDDETEDNI